MVDAPTLLPEGRPDDKTRLGYAMVATAATLFAVNGSVSKVVLGSGLSSLELAQIRNTCAAILFLAFLLVVAPSRLRVGRRELALPRRVRPRRHRARAVALLRRHREPPGRRRAAHRVHRAALRRALRALRLQGARPAAHLGRGRPVPHRPRARRRALGGRRVQHGRRHRRVRRRARAHRLPPHGRARAPAPRRRLALVLRLPLRGAALGGRSSRSGTSRGTSSTTSVSLQGNLSEYSAPVWVLVALHRRHRDDGHVLAAHGVAPAHQRDARLDRRHARARRRDGRRVGLARRDVRRRRSSSAAPSSSPGILVAQSAR